MNVIYEPKGRAREYSPLACNLYMGCTHGCKYCYAPACMRKKPEAWHESARARCEDVLKLFDRDCAKLAKERKDDEMRRVLFCFLSDPYQPLERELHLTRRGIAIAASHGIKIDILTKGESDLIEQDLPLMLESQTHLGITLSFINDDSRCEWEPMASSVQSRLRILQKAHKMGIFTWVSMEPVIIPDEALAVIRKAHGYVDFWKVGKLNHNKAVEQSVDWPQFREDAIALLDSFGSKYYIKEDLRSA
ncbi:MAG: hypothetical protein J6333_13155 [Planctomycetes bacterium]|nr:hypothetical protein [Planctomycetota bacterium]